MLHLHHNHYLLPFKSLNSGFHASENPLCFLYHINDSHPLGLVLVQHFFKYEKHFLGSKNLHFKSMQQRWRALTDLV